MIEIKMTTPKTKIEEQLQNVLLVFATEFKIPVEYERNVKQEPAFEKTPFVFNTEQKEDSGLFED